MEALLAFSATHLAWKTANSDTESLAYQHRSTAHKGLHETMGSLSEKNAEAILAASILLTWQAKDWHVHCSLLSMQLTDRQAKLEIAARWDLYSRYYDEEHWHRLT